jgi:molybdopterin synthase catalytic subunit
MTRAAPETPIDLGPGTHDDKTSTMGSGQADPGKEGAIVATDSISLERLIARVKKHPEIAGAGMILCHNGIVRNSDRSGEKRVTGLRVEVNHSEIERIRHAAQSRKGIVAVEIEALEGEFQVGDDLLYVVVAGDVRENVFSVMRETVEMIKAGGVTKTEYYSE